MKNTYQLTVVLSILIILISCQKESNKKSKNNCVNNDDVTYLIDDKSYLTFIYANKSVLRYKNDKGSELSFLFLDKGNTQFSKYMEFETCMIDTTQEISTDHLMETVTTSLRNSKSDIMFHQQLVLNVNLTYLGENEYYDELTVSNRQIEGGSTSSIMRILINQRTAGDNLPSHFSHPVSSVELLGKTFNNVYISDDSMLYFTLDQGIIGFKDLMGDLWRLE